MQLIAYLNFNGQAAEALTFYAQVLKAEVASRMTYADAPAEWQGEHPEHLMHAALKGNDFMLDLADVPAAHHHPGHTASLMLHFESVAELEETFEALSQGGQVTMPVQDTFWGARYGQLVDRFGVSWMLHANLPQQA